ncbi:MAG: cobalamin biosynthesis protein [Ketobacter sp.]|nr:cobalamin biosynthesis protein [Ketobacter sp.]
MPIVVIKILIALGLDQLLGEPKQYHPLVGFGRLAGRLESRFNHPASRTRQRLLGLLAWLLAVTPMPLALWWLQQTWLGASLLGITLDILLLYLCVGRKSLFEHSLRVHRALDQADLPLARQHTSMIVSRECQQLDEAGCARATVESVLENGNDSIYGALFWFTLLGGSGAVLYRLANTLDAMWGYRNRRYLHFGWAAAKLDDLLNYFPARICALCYALAGNRHQALASWRQHGHQLSSPNGGPVMCAGAGALNVQLGGPATYHGTLLRKPYYGGNTPACPRHIIAANRLVDRSLVICIALCLVIPGILYGVIQFSLQQGG